MRFVWTEKFVGTIETRPNSRECALVNIYSRPEGSKYGIDFNRQVASYETLSNGASSSARKEIKKLLKELAE